MADEKRLIVVSNGGEVGEVTQDSRGQMTFTYRESWRNGRSRTPLSLSMPLVQARHGHRVVDPFLRGLLPDKQGVLEAQSSDDGHVDQRQVPEQPAE
jgi:serine/threonine-protein kinase HipA